MEIENLSHQFFDVLSKHCKKHGINVTFVPSSDTDNYCDYEVCGDVEDIEKYKDLLRNPHKLFQFCSDDFNKNRHLFGEKSLRVTITRKPFILDLIQEGVTKEQDLQIYEKRQMSFIMGAIDDGMRPAFDGQDESRSRHNIS
ncbi:hypothetical protein ACFL0U_01050 [Pseudomonadota bacterium]